jgi:hypothetical protein
MYELRSYAQPLLKGHQPIPLGPSSDEGSVTPIEVAQVVAAATRLFGSADCWHITITAIALDGQGNIVARGTPHWCANVEQVQMHLTEETP